MKECDIIDAYLRIRKNDQVIPDEVLDFMKNAAIDRLRNENSEPDETPEYMVWWYGISYQYTIELIYKYKMIKPVTEEQIKNAYEKENGEFR